ncbi:MAG: DinB family protein [Bacteroidota bacterium]
MQTTVQALRQIRAHLCRLTDDLTEAQLLVQPPGFSNNILWNLGHVVVTQQLLHYRLAGVPLHVPDEVVGLFRKGTSPTSWTEQPAVAPVRAWLTELPERLVEDYAAGRFETYQTYPTSTGIVLHTMEEAVAFNLFHEGLHVHAVQRLLKAQS